MDIPSKCCKLPVEEVAMPASHAHTGKLVCTGCKKFQRWARSEKTKQRVREYLDLITVGLTSHKTGRANEFLVDLQNGFTGGKITTLSPSQYNLLKRLGTIVVA